MPVAAAAMMVTAPTALVGVAAAPFPGPGPVVPLLEVAAVPVAAAAVPVAEIFAPVEQDEIVD